MAGLYITVSELAEMIGVCELTVKRWIDAGTLPQPTVGSKGSKIQAWHKSVLAADALFKLSGRQDVSRTDEILRQNMNIDLLSSLDRLMSQELAYQLYADSPKQ